jgi:hypothetical protein
MPAAIIEIIPEVEWVVTPDEFIDISRFLSETEFTVWKEFEADYPGKQVPATKIRWGSSTYTAFSALGAAFAALAVVATLAQVITVVQQAETPTKRRRRRTYLCVSKCLGIIHAAQEDVGVMENRALETEEKPKRKARKFKSRS